MKMTAALRSSEQRSHPLLVQHYIPRAQCNPNSTNSRRIWKNEAKKQLTHICPTHTENETDRMGDIVPTMTQKIGTTSRKSREKRAKLSKAARDTVAKSDHHLFEYAKMISQPKAKPNASERSKRNRGLHEIRDKPE